MSQFEKQFFHLYYFNTIYFVFKYYINIKEIIQNNIKKNNLLYIIISRNKNL